MLPCSDVYDQDIWPQRLHQGPLKATLYSPMISSPLQMEYLSSSPQKLLQYFLGSIVTFMIQDRLHEIAIGTTSDLFQKTGLYPQVASHWVRIKCWPLAVVETAVPLYLSYSLANLPRFLLECVITWLYGALCQTVFLILELKILKIFKSSSANW